MMAKVVSEINWGLASRRLQGIEAPNRCRLVLARLCVCSDQGLYERRVKCTYSAVYKHAESDCSSRKIEHNIAGHVWFKP